MCRFCPVCPVQALPASSASCWGPCSSGSAPSCRWVCRHSLTATCWLADCVCSPVSASCRSKHFLSVLAALQPGHCKLRCGACCFRWSHNTSAYHALPCNTCRYLPTPPLPAPWSAGGRRGAQAAPHHLQRTRAHHQGTQSSQRRVAASRAMPHAAWLLSRACVLPQPAAAVWPPPTCGSCVAASACSHPPSN